MHEYAQFASIIKKLLAFRHQKHAQLELTQDSLEHKRAGLEELERTEREASRLEEALSQGRVSNPLDRSVRANGIVSQSSSTNGVSENDGEEAPHSADPSGRHNDYAASEAFYTPPPPISGPPPRRSGSGMGLLNALSYTIHGMMDVDPETARRNTITKTRESISQVRNDLVVNS